MLEWGEGSVQMAERGPRRDSSLLVVAQNDSGSVQNMWHYVSF